MTSSHPPRPLGASGLKVSPLGVGTNRWGGKLGPRDAVLQTYQAALDTGVDFFDTAELYTFGKSERLVGECAAADGREVVLASKMFPYPTRVTAGQFVKALDRSLARTARDTIDLYYLHFPYSTVRIEKVMDVLAKAVKAEKVRAVGVSNFNVTQLRRAAAALERHGIPLAANQVHYSITHRQPETNGVLDACRELDVALVAYRPLGGGAIYGDGSAKNGDLLGTVREIAGTPGRTVGQVALNWLIQRHDNVIAIPGTTKPDHVRQNADALSWSLSADELDVSAGRLPGAILQLGKRRFVRLVDGSAG